MDKYWTHEKPIEIDTGANILRLFEKAGKMQICNPYWEDKDENKQHGKTVTLDITALLETPEAGAVFERLLKNV